MKVAVTFHEAYSPEPYCMKLVPTETRVFSEDATFGRHLGMGYVDKPVRSMAPAHIY